MPDHIKQEIFLGMKPILEDWCGHELTQTALYGKNLSLSHFIHSCFKGIRIYTHGSTLQNHVDRPDTHVVSGILNIQQVL